MVRQLGYSQCQLFFTCSALLSHCLAMIGLLKRQFIDCYNRDATEAKDWRWVMKVQLTLTSCASYRDAPINEVQISIIIFFTNNLISHCQLISDQKSEKPEQPHVTNPEFFLPNTYCKGNKLNFHKIHPIFWPSFNQYCRFPTPEQHVFKVSFVNGTKWNLNFKQNRSPKRDCTRTLSHQGTHYTCAHTNTNEDAHFRSQLK